MYNLLLVLYMFVVQYIFDDGAIFNYDRKKAAESVFSRTPEIFDETALVGNHFIKEHVKQIELNLLATYPGIIIIK